MNNLDENTSQVTIRILVADDDAAIRDSYGDILQTKHPQSTTRSLDDMRTRLFGPSKTSTPTAERFDPTFCAGAEDAVQAVKDGKIDGRPYSVVFLDMRMPPGLMVSGPRSGFGSWMPALLGKRILCVDGW